MAVKTFDNLGNGSGTWEDGTDWDPVNVPVDNDTIVINENCSVSTDYSDRTFEDLDVANGKTLTVQNGGDVRFDTAANVSLLGSLTIETGGNAYFTDCGYLRSTGGTITLDGGTLWIVETDNTVMYLELRGGTTVVGTANGGTIKLSAANLQKAYIYANQTGANIIGDSGNRLVIEDVGAAKSYLNLSDTNILVQNIEFDGLYEIRAEGAAFDNCLVHSGTDGLVATREKLTIRDSFIYGNSGIGLKSFSVTQYAYADLHNVVFGETAGAVGSDNVGGDIDLDSLAGHAHNCKLSSTIPFAAQTATANLTFDSYDQDEADWRQYQGAGHLAQAESGAGAQGGSGTAVKCVSSASCADNDYARFRRLVAVIPATHGDLIDVTLQTRGTNTKTATLRIDPDGIYGATQSLGITADGTWNLRTIPQYTVNLSGGAGAMAGIPIYLDMTGASETWFYDTLDWTIT
jgi:hypothetical protein